LLASRDEMIGQRRGSSAGSCWSSEGHLQAKAEGKYKGRKPTARLKAEDVMRLYRGGKRVAHITKELGIGRGSVYRALEAAGLTATS
jgi:DNA invertase Pin-like site-specific DNA recombinase